MSRIAGIVDLACDVEIKDDILKTLHRTPVNDHGYYMRDDAMFLHRSISGCNCGQPIQIMRGNKRYIIVFDGELYNSESLYQELLKLGHNIPTKTDASIALCAYLEWEEDALYKFIGAFSFAVWNEQSRTLFLARDKMGIRPMFYALHHNGLIFSSEIKTILRYPTFHTELDEEGIAQVMLIGPGRIPGSGVFKNVLELEPGHYLIYKGRSVSIQRYWSLQDRIHMEDFDETADHVRYLVTESILRQIDNQVGALLSGGLDSSIINAICSNKLNEQGRTLKTFSVDYLGNDVHFIPERFQPESDNQYIEIMRQEINSDHHRIVLNAKDLVNCLENATKARDLPGMADIDFSLMSFAEKIKKDCPSVLSGECADEIFGGYPWFTDASVRPSNGFPWSQNISYRANFISRAYKINANEYVNDQYNTSMKYCNLLPENSFEDLSVKKMTWLNHYWFMQTLIDRNDRMCMYSGLKIRAPFCDPAIAEYLFAIPWSYKYYSNREKGILRHAMRGLIPDKILWRKKSPYPKTYDPEYTKMVKIRLRQLLTEKNAALWDIIDRDAASKLLIEEDLMPWYGQLMKGPQTIAFFLQIDYWLKEYKISLV